ncbi:MAG: exonuclease SbcCD subunit D [Lachnospiraceae bacterium]|nr:exonuclease SbcCD subunit D [Lachnospiraceae bacterium]MBP3567909.1 exonuclease SbcCD subunit D [Lachnospiraceae bacterium]
MKLLHLADLHIGKRVYEYSMLEEQKAALTQAFRMAVERKVDAVLIAGDVYDKNIPTIEGVKLFDTFLTALKQKDIPTFIISGNHDSAERLSFGRHLFESSRIYLSGTYEEEIFKKTLCDEFGEVDIYLLPFLKPQQIEVKEEEEKPQDYTGAIKLVLNRLDINKNNRNVLLAHQFVGGGSTEPFRADSETQSVGGVDMVDYRVFDNFDYVALGHLHGAQHVGRETVRYAGSPVKYSFSEARQEKSATLITLGKKQSEASGQEMITDISIEKLPFTPVHDMREIKGTLQQLTNPDVLSESDCNDYMHITLTDEEEIYDVFGKLRAAYPNLMTLDFDNARTRAEGAVMLTGEVMKEKSTMELFRDFFEKQTGSMLSPMQEQILTDIIEKNRE